MTTTTDINPALRSSFERDGDQLARTLSFKDAAFTTWVMANERDADPLGAWWRAYLQGETPATTGQVQPVRTAELFCGSGGLAQGFRQAALEVGLQPQSVAAADHDPEAVIIYEKNHHPLTTSSRSVTELIDYRVKWRNGAAQFRYEPELLDEEWARHIGEIDVLLAGPPCQGHSNLNNHSRRVDKRNELYLSVAAFAVATGAPAVVIENVQAVVHDRLGVVAATTDLLEAAGYQVETGTLRADQLGWAQRRNRFFLVARRDRAPLPIADVAAALAAEPRDVMWAIGDLADVAADDHMHRRPVMSDENRNRIAYLFDHDVHNLPLSERPDCHKDGTTYTSVYGRMHSDLPAPTITTGFLTPGRGRYVHPTQQRTLTPAEAARLQGFPDTYRFELQSSEPPSSAKLTKWIGDAVPMPLGYAAGLAVLGPGRFEQ